MLGILVIVSMNVIDKSCDVGEYLDYENCKCKKRLINKSVNECTETIEEVKLFNIMFAENENENSCKRISCTVYIVFLLIYFTINVGGIVTYYIYSQWYLKKIHHTLTLILKMKQRFGKHILTLKIELIILTTIKTLMQDGNKYLVLDDVNENREVSQKYEEAWNGIKKDIEKIDGGK